MPGALKTFLEELRRRRVLRVVAAYAVFAFGALQGADVVVNALGLPRGWMTALVVLVFAGFPVTAVLAWVFDLTPEGVVRTPALPRSSAAAPPAVGHSRLAAAAGLLALVVGAGGAGLWWHARSGADALSRDLVAVLPFTVRGAGQYAYLREGMVELLGASLWAGGLRAVDERVILRQVERGGERDLDDDAGRSLARRYGAGLFALGSVVEVKDRLRLQVRLFDTRGGAALAQAGAEGEAGRLFQMVDELLGQLRPALLSAGAVKGGGMEMLARTTTTSLPALKAFLEGEREMRRGEFAGALRALQKAVAEDPEFALAHYRLAVAASWAHEVDLGRASLHHALANRDKLAPRQRRLFEAFLAYWQGRAKEAEGLYRALLAELPEDAESWYQLGEVVFHNAALQGRSPAEAREPFERALAIDPDQLAPVNHLVALAHLTRDRAELGRQVARELKARPDDPYLLWQRAFAEGEKARLAEAEAKLPRATLFLKAQGERALYGADAAPMIEALRAEAARPGLTPAERLAVGGVLARALLTAGRRVEALREMTALEAQLPKAGPGLSRAMVATLAFLASSREELVAARAGLPPAQDLPGRPPAASQRLRDYLTGVLSAALLDTEAAAGAVQRLETSVDEDGSALGRDLALGVRARAAWARGNAQEALAWLERQSGGVPVSTLGDPWLAGTSEQWLHAEALRALGRAAEAERWYLAGDLEASYWLVPRALRRAEMLELLGRRAEAAESYQRGLSLWGQADPELQPLVEQSRTRLAALLREPGNALAPAQR